MDEWRRREIGISGGGSLRSPRPTQGCSAEKKKILYKKCVKGFRKFCNKLVTGDTCFTTITYTKVTGKINIPFTM